MRTHNTKDCLIKKSDKKEERPNRRSNYRNKSRDRRSDRRSDSHRSDSDSSKGYRKDATRYKRELRVAEKKVKSLERLIKRKEVRRSDLCRRGTGGAQQYAYLSQGEKQSDSSSEEESSMNFSEPTESDKERKRIRRKRADVFEIQRDQQTGKILYT